MNPRPLWQLTLSRLRELSREPGTMFWAFGFPILLSVALGMAFKSNGDAPIKDGEVRYIDFLVPGLMGMNLMSGSMWAVGWGLVNLRTKKLLKRLLATPLRRWHLLASLALARLALLPLEVASLLLFARVIFGMPLPGPGALVLLAAVGVLGWLSFSCLAVCVASRAQNVETMTGLINAVMIPMFVLSGVFFPASRFPPVLHPALSLLPLTALNDALRGVIVGHAHPPELVRPVVILVAWGAASAMVACRTFRWS